MTLTSILFLLPRTLWRYVIVPLWNIVLVGGCLIVAAVILIGILLIPGREPDRNTEYVSLLPAGFNRPRRAP